MATVKMKFRSSTKEDKEGVLYYQIIHNRIIRQIKTDYKIYNSEWNESSSCIIILNYHSRRELSLLAINDRAKFEIKRLREIIKSVDSYSMEYSIDDIIDIYEKTYKGVTLFDFILETAQKLKELGNIRTSDTYTSLLNSFMIFREGEDLILKSLDADILEIY